MTKLNGYTIIDRGNRPTVLQRVGLQTFFVDDGVYVDPYQVSSVMIFRKDDLNDNNIATTIGGDGLVLSSASPYMRFAPSGDASDVESFDPEEYDPGTEASGIYRMGEGQYVVVLDGTVNLSGSWQGARIANTASSVADWVDVWTVKMVEGSNFQTLINNFELFGDTIFTITEPLLLKTHTHLATRHVPLGSKVNLKFTNEITVENKTITQGVENIFRQSAITSPKIEIKKINEDVNLPSRVTVSGFDNAIASGLINVTSDNTVVFPLDTTVLQSVLNGVGGGAATGTYTAQLKFNLINETILSPLFHFIVR
jgi:hypothetical protein